MTKTPDHLFFVRPETLTDGSKVFNVWYGDIKFSAVTEEDAEELANKLMDAINDHTNDVADFIDER
jgi:hypothetical protein